LNESNSHAASALDILRTVFKRYPPIKPVYLFGSSASGQTHAESDLDLAVLADGNSLYGRKLDILTELAKNGFYNVDSVFLPGDDVVLQYEAVYLNRIVYQRPDFDAASVFSLIVRR
jgi:predicted nucleotidyltransferase